MTGGSAYPFTFYANAISGSAGYNAQWRILWNAGGDTGYQTFNPGNNVYGLISNSVNAQLAQRRRRFTSILRAQPVRV